MNWKTIFNPFLKFDEKTLLIAGFVSITSVFLFGYYFGLQTDSLFHFRLINSEDSLSKIILSTLIVYAISILIFFVFGKIINKKTRFIDVVNPILISQFIVILLLLISEIPLVKNAQKQIIASVENQSFELDMISLLITTINSFVSLAITAYGMAILFNGFRTATNMKDWRHIVIFVLLLLTIMLTMQLL
ncbi:YIP1 family protein [Chryseobacterium formosus]|uniref:YIP1 family protein n=1 Tax=Chryseobacterium formosus TaxID=1537363 RepID=A0ABT3XX13_9FLAO|nr:YIP1 family protein [Chryseobacterium formosus]MCX8526195.1 YIP1 family protein [Chryseobacterium formosus]